MDSFAKQLLEKTTDNLPLLINTNPPQLFIVSYLKTLETIIISWC
jgi:hypothetical protein